MDGVVSSGGSGELWSGGGSGDQSCGMSGGSSCGRAQVSDTNGACAKVQKRNHLCNQGKYEKLR